MDFSKIYSFFTEGPWHWVAQAFIVVFASLLVDFIHKIIANRIVNSRTGSWRRSFVDAVRAPLSVCIWIVGITAAAQVLEKQMDTNFETTVVMLRKVGVVLSLSWFLVRLVKRGEAVIHESYEQKGKSLDQTTADAVSKILRISILITTGLVMLQTLGFSISGVLAFGGIGGIAIGFAAKDMLANFFGAMMIYWDRPFKVGDWIRSPDREIEGTVEAIGWRLTCIRTFDKRPLYVPNALFANISVENPSRMSHRRIYEKIGVRYADSNRFLTILADIREMLQTHPEIDQNQTLMVNFLTLADSSLEFFIYTFTRTTVWTKFHEVKEEILMKVYNIIESHGADVAFPTTTIQVEDRGVLSILEQQQVKSSAANRPPASVGKILET